MFCESLDQFVGIDFVFIGGDSDEIDQSEDAADTEAEAHDDLEDTFFGFTHHKIVNANTTEEEADDDHGDFVFAGEVTTSFFERHATFHADIGRLADLLTAVGTERMASPNFHTALEAHGLVVTDAFAAICTIHSSFS